MSKGIVGGGPPASALPPPSLPVLPSGPEPEELEQAEIADPISKI
jgi:hypothetical protein